MQENTSLPLRWEQQSQEAWIQVPSQSLTGFVSEGKTPFCSQPASLVSNGAEALAVPRAAGKTGWGLGVQSNVTAAKHHPV